MTIKPMRPINRDQAVVGFKEFLCGLGYDLGIEPGMNRLASGRDSAERAVDAYIEFLSKQQEHFEFTTFPSEGSSGMVTVTHIEFASLCEHHLLPYTGFAHVGYIAGGQVCGLSKIVRVVDHYAHRPSIQEVLTSKIATFLWEQLEPQGCGVVIEASHTCMSIRGVERPGHITVTSDVRGCFKQVAVRSEFLALIQQSKSTR